MKITLHKTLLLTTLLFSTKAMCLVDYSGGSSSSSSDDDVVQTKSSSVVKRSTSVSKAKMPSSGGGTGYRPTGLFEFSTSMESLKYPNTESESKVNFINLDARANLPWELYLDMSYYFAKAGDYQYASSTSNQKGNMDFRLGVNWFTMGQGRDQARVDFYAGAVLPEENSDYATSRTDKIFGLESTRTFGSAVLGLGYEVKLTGTPKSSKEKDVGNIQTLKAALGFQVGQDIKFLFEGRYTNIAQGDENFTGGYLDKKVSFGTLSPELQLNLAALCDLTLGGSFRTKRVGQENTYQNAGLWGHRGLFGNSVQVGLNIRI